jgi:hypothetical protein
MKRPSRSASKLLPRPQHGRSGSRRRAGPVASLRRACLPVHGGGSASTRVSGALSMNLPQLQGSTEG